MKKYCMNSGRKIIVRAMFTLLVSMSYCSSRAANIEFTATFIAATCKVSAPALLDFGDVVASDIKKGISNANPIPLDVTLSQCQGFVGPVNKPGLLITGNGITNSGEFLFMQPASTRAANYGFRVKTSSGTQLSSERTFLPVPLDTTNPDGASVVVPFNVSISCGECDDYLTKSGTLSATLTFNFVYQ
ncbi:MAG: fimbrial protein [Enterobacter cloacae]|nr:fimbrial protein [Enterobacter cloacae]